MDPLYFPDGQIRQEVYVYGSFLQSKMYREGVTCKDCHDPHGLHVRGEGNGVCASCHLPEKFDTTAHYFHESGSAGARCVACHMPERNYMVVDPRRDHSFRVPRPDLSVAIGTPNACTGCHRDRSAEWAADAVRTWHGGPRSAHYGEALAAALGGTPGAGNALVRLVTDVETPDIVRATALSMLSGHPSSSSVSVLGAALRNPDPMVRLGAVEGSDVLDAAVRHRLLVPLLRDDVRSVRIEAARSLAVVPRDMFTPGQWESLARFSTSIAGRRSETRTGQSPT